MKESIDILNSDNISADGITITATNDTSIKSSALTPIKNMVITQALDTAGIKLIFTADINMSLTSTPLKAIPTESLSITEIEFQAMVSTIQDLLIVFASAGRADLMPGHACLPCGMWSLFHRAEFSPAGWFSPAQADCIEISVHLFAKNRLT